MKTLAVALLLTTLTSSLLGSDDFAFESSDELDDQTNVVSDWGISYQKIVTTTGRVFHLMVPKHDFGKNVTEFEAKLQGGKPLPSWLLFDKVDAVFWGVPMKENSGSIHVIVKSIGSKKHLARNIIIDIVSSSEPPRTNKECHSAEEVIMLTLVINKRIEKIDPKQRVTAINDISKFFGIPYSAFTLKPSNEHDNITDNSILLAGPGNVKTRSSNTTSSLEVLIACDLRMFPQTNALIRQLRQQAKDGTISEVLRMPVSEWLVRVKRLNIERKRRQALDLGSGDYEGDYYDDYEEDNDDYEEENGNPLPTPSKDLSTTSQTTSQRIITTTISTTNFENSSTHPHRHHHGEVKKEEIIPVWPIVDDNSLNNENVLIPITSPEVPITPSTTLGTTTAQLKSTTTLFTTSTTTERSPTRNTPSTTTVNMEFPVIQDTRDEDDYVDYKTNDYDEEDDDDDLGDVESETLVPIPQTPRKIIPITQATRTTTTSTTTEPIVVEQTTISEGIPTVREIPTTSTVNLDNTKMQTSPVYTTTTNIPTVVTEAETDVPITVAVITTISTTQPTTPATTTTSTTTTTAKSTTTPTTTTTTTTTTTPPPTTTASSTTYLPTFPSILYTETSEDEELTTPTKMTTLRHASSTSFPITMVPEEEYETKNYPPYIENRLKRKNVIAGKIFRFVIPEDTFKDSEDNYDLKLEFLDSEENPITANSWCQFNPVRREIYGLPLDDHVSKWEYVIRATDKDGASVQDRLTILVQQHKLQRVFNHEFSLEIRIEKRDEFRHYIDWSLKTLRALGRIYNTNMSEITVRKVGYTTQPVIFTWTNDSLPTSYCPKPEIEKLFKILTANDRGDPSRELNVAVAPELRVKKVSYHGMGVCEELNTPIAPPVNYPPILRNPVNHINATVGELLIFRVPKDTFYDPEDLDTLSLNLTLLTADRQEIPSHNWLQFDSKNREFFGIPRKTSRSEYQLVCIDSGGLPVIDSLEVVVYPASRVQYNVEFSMTIETTYDTFINSAILQKKFVEKLVDIFGDKNSSHMHFLPLKQKQHSTIATWYNKSLSTEKCPHEQIARLEAMMKNEERGISNRVHAIMEPDFQVSTIKVLPMSNCKVHKTKYHVPKLPEDKIIIDESAQTTPSSDEYLLTFIVPVVVISIMTFFALLAACILYRRRRTGKMNIVEEGRQSYGNKGIPVIFQEELDEKPEAGTKAPVILKDEKPPLAPPEYSKSGSLKFNDDSEPYHPPPPFTRTQDNGKQSRPKPAPTYRKPPPYVPP